MYGIYKYENGLHFTGKIANSKAEAERYLANEYGSYKERFIGFTALGERLYETVFVPHYNKKAFEIIELEIV